MKEERGGPAREVAWAAVWSRPKGAPNAPSPEPLPPHPLPLTFSSISTGRWLTTSMGYMSPAMTPMPFSPFLRPFTTSLTPLRIHLALEDLRTSLCTFFVVFLLQRGEEMQFTAFTLQRVKRLLCVI